MKRILRRSLLLGGAFLLAGCLAGPFSALSAYAHIAICRTDPTVTLSNGASMTLYADVYDTASDITSANFVLHIPVGMSVKSVAYDTTYEYLEHLSWVADQNAGIYHTDTLVYTKTSGISVGANASSTMSTCQLSNKSTQGLSSFTIHINFNC